MFLQALLGLSLVFAGTGVFAQDDSAMPPAPAADSATALPPTAPAPDTSIAAPAPDADKNAAPTAMPAENATTPAADATAPADATVTPPSAVTSTPPGDQPQVAPMGTPAPAAVAALPTPAIPDLKVEGAPHDWQINLGPSASTIEDHLVAFHNMLLVTITAITIFVFVLLGYTIVRFRRREGDVPSTRTHHMALEVVWTIIPVLILAVLAFPSFKLMYYMDKAKNPELTVKITGHQWYWGYEFPDLGIDEYASNIIPENKLQAGQPRLLAVDEPLVVPVDTDVQFLITGSDVIHSWFVPTFGINRSAIPGRINESWARITKPGIYYGQCSKICGINHGYMPIEVRAVPKDVFKAWADTAKASGVDKANAQILGLKTADAGNTALASAQ
jgi:cytochrome c oxidase subunit 2